MKRYGYWTLAVLATPAAAWATGAEPAAHGGEHGGAFPLGEVVAAVVNFVLYVGLLVWLTRKAVKSFYQKRTEELNEAVAKAKAALDEAERLHNEAAERLAHATEEAERHIQNAKETAGRTSREILGAAKVKADKMLTDAQATIAAETARLEQEVREQMSRQVVEIARAQLARDVDPSSQRRLVNHYLDHVEEA